LLSVRNQVRKKRDVLHSSQKDSRYFTTSFFGLLPEAFFIYLLLIFIYFYSISYERIKTFFYSLLSVFSLLFIEL